MWLPPENRKHAAGVLSAPYAPRQARPPRAAAGRYQPRGAPYSPGRRIAPTPPPAVEISAPSAPCQADAALAARIAPIAPLQPRPEPPAAPPEAVASALEPMTLPEQPAAEAIREIVLFGPDPLAGTAKLDGMPQERSAALGPVDSSPVHSSTIEPSRSDAEVKSPTAQRPSLLRLLFETRWWVLVPVAMAMAAIGLIRLHEGQSSIRARDGAVIDLVFDNVKAVTEIHADDTLTPRTGRHGDAEALVAVPATGPVMADRAPRLALAAERSGYRAQTQEIAHVGALPRAAICAYDGGGTPAVAARVRAAGAGFGAALADAAEAQVRSFVVYNDGYRTLKYPGGDVAPLYGVCSDVVVRAYRALGIDLQQRVHEARVGSSDVSIAHRRTQTLRRLFAREGASLPISDFDDDYRPGDVVSYDRPQNRGVQDHIAIVSNVRGPSGRYMIVHNRGFGPQIEDALFVDRISGHYRYQGVHRKPTTVASEETADKNLKRAKKQRAFREARKKRRTGS